MKTLIVNFRSVQGIVSMLGVADPSEPEISYGDHFNQSKSVDSFTTILPDAVKEVALTVLFENHDEVVITDDSGEEDEEDFEVIPNTLSVTLGSASCISIKLSGGPNNLSFSEITNSASEAASQ